MLCRGQAGGDEQSGVLHHPQRHPTLIPDDHTSCRTYYEGEEAGRCDIMDGFGKDRRRREHGLRKSIRRLRALQVSGRRGGVDCA
ncbi:hypothetical protein K443DRAFT_686957, partial [Laccaria amethystina LaAM-08-1]